MVWKQIHDIRVRQMKSLSLKEKIKRFTILREANKYPSILTPQQTLFLTGVLDNGDEWMDTYDELSEDDRALFTEQEYKDFYDFFNPLL